MTCQPHKDAGNYQSIVITPIVVKRDTKFVAMCILVDLPGLLEACRGYDTPSGNPHPSKGFTDPGLPNLICCISI